MANRFWRAGGIELSRYELQGSFPAHLHRRALVVLVEAGAEMLQVGRERTICAAGDIALIAPEEVHYNTVCAGSAVRYRVFSVDLDSQQPSFGLTMGARRIRNSTAFSRLVELHRALERSDCPPQHALCVLLPMLADHLGRRPRGDDWITFLAGILKEKLTANLRLPELAAMVGLSPRHVARQFTTNVGLTPRAYRDAFRIELARDTIALGTPLARAAQLSGFCDQSHLNRRFRRLVGDTPARFAAGLKLGV